MHKIMISINKWWEQFENAGSRKLVSIRHFSSTAGNDSKGYRKLMRMGVSGLTAFGAFQALCQLMASLGTDARKSGSTINSDGSHLDIIDLSDLTRIPVKVLSSNIDTLVSIGWLLLLEPLEAKQSPDDLPSPPAAIPPIPQGTPNGEERRGGESKGEESIEHPADPRLTIDQKAELVWKEYPRKLGKEKSIAAIKRELKTRCHIELAAIVKEFALSVADTDKEFIPHGSTYFCNKRFNDEIETRKDPAKPKTNGIVTTNPDGSQRIGGREFSIIDPSSELELK